MVERSGEGRRGADRVVVVEVLVVKVVGDGVGGVVAAVTVQGWGWKAAQGQDGREGCWTR